MKIFLVSEDEIRLEVTPGPMTIEADSYEMIYSPYHMLASSLAPARRTPSPGRDER